MQQNRQWTIVARILRPQGRKGEVLADLLTDFPDRFTQHPDVQLAPAGFAEAGEPKAALQPIQIVSHWLPTGRNVGRVVLHFAGVTSITEAEALAGKEVVIPLADRVPLDAESIYITDLTGCTVYDRDLPLGTVDSVQFPASSDGGHRLDDAAPLLSVLARDGAEILIPFAKSYLLKIDLVAKTIHMDLPEGLADLNRPATSSE